MQQIVQDPNKSALIQAVMAGLGDNPKLAMQAVCKLAAVLPVYLNSITDLGMAAEAFVEYVKGSAPIPEWYKRASVA